MGNSQGRQGVAAGAAGGEGAAGAQTAGAAEGAAAAGVGAVEQQPQQVVEESAPLHHDDDTFADAKADMTDEDTAAEGGGNGGFSTPLALSRAPSQIDGTRILEGGALPAPEEGEQVDYQQLPEVGVPSYSLATTSQQKAEQMGYQQLPGVGVPSSLTSQQEAEQMGYQQLPGADVPSSLATASEQEAAPLLPHPTVLAPSESAELKALYLQHAEKLGINPSAEAAEAEDTTTSAATIEPAQASAGLSQAATRSVERSESELLIGDEPSLLDKAKSAVPSIFGGSIASQQQSTEAQQVIEPPTLLDQATDPVAAAAAAVTGVVAGPADKPPSALADPSALNLLEGKSVPELFENKGLAAPSTGIAGAVKRLLPSSFTGGANAPAAATATQEEMPDEQGLCADDIMGTGEGERSIGTMPQSASLADTLKSTLPIGQGESVATELSTQSAGPEAFVQDNTAVIGPSTTSTEQDLLGGEPSLLDEARSSIPAVFGSTITTQQLTLPLASESSPTLLDQATDPSAVPDVSAVAADRADQPTSALADPSALNFTEGKSVPQLFESKGLTTPSGIVEAARSVLPGSSTGVSLQAASESASSAASTVVETVSGSAAHAANTAVEMARSVLPGSSTGPSAQTVSGSAASAASTVMETVSGGAAYAANTVVETAKSAVSAVFGSGAPGIALSQAPSAQRSDESVQTGAVGADSAFAETTTPSLAQEVSSAPVRQTDEGVQAGGVESAISFSLPDDVKRSMPAVFDGAVGGAAGLPAGVMGRDSAGYAADQAASVASLQTVVLETEPVLSKETSTAVAPESVPELVQQATPLPSTVSKQAGGLVGSIPALDSKGLAPSGVVGAVDNLVSATPAIVENAPEGASFSPTSFQAVGAPPTLIDKVKSFMPAVFGGGSSAAPAATASTSMLPEQQMTTFGESVQTGATGAGTAIAKPLAQEAVSAPVQTDEGVHPAGVDSGISSSLADDVKRSMPAVLGGGVGSAAGFQEGADVERENAGYAADQVASAAPVPTGAVLGAERVLSADTTTAFPAPSSVPTLAEQASPLSSSVALEEAGGIAGGVPALESKGLPAPSGVAGADDSLVIPTPAFENQSAAAGAYTSTPASLQGGAAPTLIDRVKNFIPAVFGGGSSSAPAAASAPKLPEQQTTSLAAEQEGGSVAGIPALLESKGLVAPQGGMVEQAKSLLLTGSSPPPPPPVGELFDSKGLTQHATVADTVASMLPDSMTETVEGPSLAEQARSSLINSTKAVLPASLITSSSAQEKEAAVSTALSSMQSDEAAKAGALEAGELNTGVGGAVDTSLTEPSLEPSIAFAPPTTSEAAALTAPGPSFISTTPTHFSEAKPLGLPLPGVSGVSAAPTDSTASAYVGALGGSAPVASPAQDVTARAAAPTEFPAISSAVSPPVEITGLSTAPSLSAMSDFGSEVSDVSSLAAGSELTKSGALTEPPSLMEPSTTFALPPQSDVAATVQSAMPEPAAVALTAPALDQAAAEAVGARSSSLAAVPSPVAGADPLDSELRPKFAQPEVPSAAVINTMQERDAGGADVTTTPAVAPSGFGDGSDAAIKAAPASFTGQAAGGGLFAGGLVSGIASKVSADEVKQYTTQAASAAGVDATKAAQVGEVARTGFSKLASGSGAQAIPAPDLSLSAQPTAPSSLSLGGITSKFSPGQVKQYATQGAAAAGLDAGAASKVGAASETAFNQLTGSSMATAGSAATVPPTSTVTAGSALATPSEIESAGAATEQQAALPASTASAPLPLQQQEVTEVAAATAPLTIVQGITNESTTQTPLPPAPAPPAGAEAKDSMTDKITQGTLAAAQSAGAKTSAAASAMPSLPNSTRPRKRGGIFAACCGGGSAQQ